jgi:hypothetical protein
MSHDMESRPVCPSPTGRQQRQKSSVSDSTSTRSQNESSCPTSEHICIGRARLSFVAVLRAGPAPRDLCTAAHACRRLRLSRRVQGILPQPGLHARTYGCNVGVLASKRQHQPAGFCRTGNPPWVPIRHSRGPLSPWMPRFVEGRGIHETGSVG